MEESSTRILSSRAFRIAPSRTVSKDVRTFGSGRRSVSSLELHQLVAERLIIEISVHLQLELSQLTTVLATAEIH